MADKKVTGPNAAMVRTKTGDEFVLRGQTIPGNLVDGEEERLEKLGVFADPPAAAAGRTAVVTGTVPAETLLTVEAEALALAGETVDADSDGRRKARRVG